MLEPLIIALAAILLIVGIVGSVLPVLPGPPLSWLGLLILKFAPSVSHRLSWTVIILVGLFTIIVVILDNILPVWSTKRIGGNKKVVWGAGIGFITGFWFGPLGIILGPFVGALIGGLISGSHIKPALIHASGAFIGFMAGIVLKFINLGVLVYYFVKVLV
ncbi:MAG: DUF456 domain-containing protein [Dysgonamonadaceae bacterium]|jgi:uncharacterized protein YqgC (DUF456 family)|nr:DUF456 domain-containing protein [Dysgonamonadaceae bacterium]MDD4246720.1 DUF456 domain-containing protein [Dysgonamonadaceae bacterium]